MSKELQSLRRYKDETKVLIRATKLQLKDYLIRINQMKESDYSLISLAKWIVIREKTIYSELNKLRDGGNQIMTGLIWCPARQKSKLEATVQDMRDRKSVNPPQLKIIKDFNEEAFVRPSFIDTNEFTWPFQEIVNTYGVPQYKEINPALFTIVTFPFEFGFMFGDVMHGTILFISSALLCFCNRTPGTTLGDLGKVRYLLLLMGFFTFYCGLMYNDFASIPLKIWGDSCYEAKHGDKVAQYKGGDCIYPAGIDPAWYLGRNELTYMNSLKMKLSVILGVSQMVLGVFLKAMNNIQFKKPIDFFFEFVP